jgi:hypothetical protein
MSQFKVNTEFENDIVILITEGYLNQEGGQMIANICLNNIDNGITKILDPMFAMPLIIEIIPSRKRLESDFQTGFSIK